MKIFSKEGKISLLIIAAIFAIPNLQTISFRFGPDFRLSSKIIHPDENGFNPEAFNINDYNDYDDFFFVISRILPKGTSKQEVIDFFKKLNISAEFHERTDQNNQLNIDVRFPKIYWPTCPLSSGKSKVDNFTFTFNNQEKLEKALFMNSCYRAPYGY